MHLIPRTAIAVIVALAVLALAGSAAAQQGDEALVYCGECEGFDNLEQELTDAGAVLGNLMEWCADPQAEDYADLPQDGSPRGGWGAPVGRQDSMILRGGSFVSGPRLASSSARNYCFASAHFNNTGFRVLLER
jgi:formylglycine-generating enzyme required for sulfatase activity